MNSDPLIPEAKTERDKNGGEKSWHDINGC